MSALMLLRGLSFSTRNICSSLSKEMKLPNQERFASLSGRGWLEGQVGNEFPLLPSIPSVLFPVRLTLERTLASNWTSPLQWGLRGRGGHGQHLSIILDSSTQASSRLQLGGPDPVSIHPPVTKTPNSTLPDFLLALLPVRPHPLGGAYSP